MNNGIVITEVVFGILRAWTAEKTNNPLSLLVHHGGGPTVFTTGAALGGIVWVNLVV